MHVSANKLSRTALAAVLAAAVALVPVGVAFAVDGDGSSAGSVSNSDSTATADKKDVSKARVDAAAADADAAKGESNNGEAPKPVDNPDNSIDDGQTSDNSFLYDASIADLAGADSYYDKQTVQVTGEVVGEAIAVTAMPTMRGSCCVTLIRARPLPYSCVAAICARSTPMGHTVRREPLCAFGACSIWHVLSMKAKVTCMLRW